LPCRITELCALCSVQYRRWVGGGQELLDYQALRERLWVPTRPGDDSGGDDTRMPVEGFTMGIALRCRDGTGEYLSMLLANMLTYDGG